MNYLMKTIRRLARSNEFQTLYSSVKNISTIKLFENNNDLSDVQLLFLHWLEIYNKLYQLLGQKEEFLSEMIINDDVYCDSFIFYRNYASKHKQKDSGKKSNKKLLHRYTFV